MLRLCFDIGGTCWQHFLGNAEVCAEKVANENLFIPPHSYTKAGLRIEDEVVNRFHRVLCSPKF